MSCCHARQKVPCGALCPEKKNGRSPQLSDAPLESLGTVPNTEFCCPFRRSRILLRSLFNLDPLNNRTAARTSVLYCKLQKNKSSRGRAPRDRHSRQHRRQSLRRRWSHGLLPFAATSGPETYVRRRRPRRRSGRDAGLAAIQPRVDCKLCHVAVRSPPSSPRPSTSCSRPGHVLVPQSPPSGLRFKRCRQRRRHVMAA